MKAVYVSAQGPDRRRQLARRSLTGVMSSPVLTVPVHAPLGDALTTMAGASVRHLAVVDEDGRCLGVLTDRAIAAVWAADHTALDQVVVRGVLDETPAVLGADAAVVDAARMMREAAVDAVAVVDGAGLPVGIVTGSDLITLLAV